MSVGTIIFVVTSVSYMRGLDNPTGWYLPEVAHPHHVLTTAGYKVVFVSPKGGDSPMDRDSRDTFRNDRICQTFMSNEVTMKDGVHILNDTLTAADINPTEYKALFYTGGFGDPLELSGATDIAERAVKIYQQGGILSAVGYGPAGFLPLKVDDESLVKGQNVTSLTNEEEAKINVDLRFNLETKLRELGANFLRGDEWLCNVQVSGRLITGQNPASARRVGEEMIKLLPK